MIIDYTQPPLSPTNSQNTAISFGRRVWTLLLNRKAFQKVAKPLNNNFETMGLWALKLMRYCRRLLSPNTAAVLKQQQQSIAAQHYSF